MTVSEYFIMVEECEILVYKQWRSFVKSVVKHFSETKIAPGEYDWLLASFTSKLTNSLLVNHVES